MGNNTMPKCACLECNSIGKYALPVRRRGGNNAYVCEYHKNALESYFKKNNNFQGKQKKHGDTIGIEFETDYASLQGRIEMLLQGFIPTSDGSIRGPEFKSCIMYGTSTIKAFLPSIDDMIASGDIGLDFDANGTHLHIGNIYHLNSRTMSYIRRFYHSLFVPLSDAMKNNPVRVKRIYGRNFTYYASSISSSSDAREHTNFINTQHEKTLEFRLCQYHDAAQYGYCIDFNRKLADIVFNTFCVKVEEMGLIEDAILTEEQKRELKQTAQKTAEKLVKEFNKA